VRDRVVVVLIVVAAVFFASGLQYTAPIIGTYSPAICGPLTDQYGNPAGDAGPCRSHEPAPPYKRPGWDWAPFWVAAD
jgi:hypothetical protein